MEIDGDGEGGGEGGVLLTAILPGDEGGCAGVGDLTPSTGWEDGIREIRCAGIGN